MRRVLERWQRSGLTLREFGEKHGIALSTLSWWRRVFRHAGDEDGNGAPAVGEWVLIDQPAIDKLVGAIHRERTIAPRAIGQHQRAQPHASRNSLKSIRDPFG
jgi:hypothetical protein